MLVGLFGVAVVAVIMNFSSTFKALELAQIEVGFAVGGYHVQSF